MLIYKTGIADQQKAEKQGRDDSIKQFSTQLHLEYLSNIKDLFVGRIQNVLSL